MESDIAAPTPDWISLEQATEITGASEAIILDTINKYKHNAEAIRTHSEDDILYLDKKQLVNLFPSSSNPVEKEKIPGAVFRWFDELRRAYEISMQTMFNRVEQVKDEHKQDIESQYTQRLVDLERNHNRHIADLKQAQSEQVDALNKHISKLERDTEFYQQQVIAQQSTIAQLNNRYDSVVLALRDKEAPSEEKDITPETKSLTQSSTPDTVSTTTEENTRSTRPIDTQETQQTPDTLPKQQQSIPAEQQKVRQETVQQSASEPSAQSDKVSDSTSINSSETASEPQPDNTIETTNEHTSTHTSPQTNEPTAKENQVDLEPNSKKPTTQQDIQQWVKQAYNLREQGDLTQAAQYFEKAALQGQEKAMGALGRAYFIGEGLEQNIESAIAWLYLASQHGFTPAAKKLEQVEVRYPDAYHNGLQLAETYAIQIKLNTDTLT
ncbi:hypothetical protein C2869_12130 [Saccharobesus litoralis]|uniref:Sel1 repeat family protein n=1 Tax=Saccharobesus litoralis TaxID=2172099 RepID=A0A2S0VSE2_9ALTE|nr:tetratricopeptide repeat protein [Saccharobesus litoralis]AWB67135.1 hypothetical protein C2869_12130 [Saccharobesus litoralis]